MQDGLEMGKGGSSETGETVAAIMSLGSDVERNGERERCLRDKEINHRVWRLWEREAEGREAARMTSMLECKGMGGERRRR